MEYVLDTLHDFRLAKSAAQSAAVLMPDCFVQRSFVRVHSQLISYVQRSAAAQRAFVSIPARPQHSAPCRPLQSDYTTIPNAKDCAARFADYIHKIRLDWLYDNRTSPFVTTEHKLAQIDGETVRTMQVQHLEYRTPEGNTIATRTTYSQRDHADCTVSYKRTYDKYGSAARKYLRFMPLPTPERIAQRKAQRKQRSQ